MDVHVPQAITDQLRRRGVDVITAIDDGFAERDDPVVLERASEFGRLVFTQDYIRWRTSAILRDDGPTMDRPIFGG